MNEGARHGRPRIHVAPLVSDEMKAAVEAGGGQLVDDVAAADAVIWTIPGQADQLKQLLADSPARWVQLPFAGIEAFFAADAIDDSRTWTCTKGIYGPATGERALALMLAVARQLHTHARERKWAESGFGRPERRLTGATVVIIGTGGIGRWLARALQPLGARVIGVNRSGADLDGAERTVTVDRLTEVVGEADFLVVAAASTAATRHLVDAELLKAMRPDVWIVNVARGPLIDTDALVEALEQARIGGAALDVTDPEPLPEDHPLWRFDNVLITPHVANTWDMAVPELLAVIERNVLAFAAGEPLEGVVDPQAGY